MEIVARTTARASRWAAIVVCSLCVAMPCAAGPFSADAIGRLDRVEDIAVATNDPVPAGTVDIPVASLSTTDFEAALSSDPDASDVSRLSERSESRDEVVPGGSLIRADSLAGTLESLLDQGLRVPETATAYRALPGMSGTSPIVPLAPAAQSLARDGSQESTWRETGFNVMRWTSAALAVLAVFGIVIVLAMPGLRRRMFFPELPPLSAPQP